MPVLEALLCDRNRALWVVSHLCFFLLKGDESTQDPLSCSLNILTFPSGSPCHEIPQGELAVTENQNGSAWLGVA